MERLNNSLIDIGNTVQEAILLATEALINKDIEKAEQVLELEKEVNQKEKDIEALCFKLMIQQHPVASDFRFISSALKMITDMERIGDHASDIATICMHIANEPYIKNLDQIKKMSEAAIEMVKGSIDAFVTKDKALAKSVIKRDDEVDALFVSIKDDLYELMIADANNGRQALDWLMIGKYYERIGDHAENIAEWTVYSITGQNKRDAAKQKKASI